MAVEDRDRTRTRTDGEFIRKLGRVLRDLSIPMPPQGSRVYITVSGAVGDQDAHVRIVVQEPESSG